MVNPFRFFCIAALLSMVVFAASIARAELPPSAYARMKAQAAEVVGIEVTRVATNTRDGQNLRDISVCADAQVISVTRSNSHLKVGDKISLRYMTFEVITSGWAGPSPSLTVQKGTHYRAWLKKAGSHFYIAAQGKSLEAVE